MQDHAALRADLPPDYFLVGDTSDDLRGLTVYLVGPATTPFEAGVFTVTLRIPDSFPQEPPTASFRTRIFHPNVDDRTGAVCVETLKRDWHPKVTLRDVLSTIRCLLVYPNPDSSLNEEAGRMLQEGYPVFERHARMMTEVYAQVPEHLQAYVDQTRGRQAPRSNDDDDDGDGDGDGGDSHREDNQEDSQEGLTPSPKRLVSTSSSSNSVPKKPSSTPTPKRRPEKSAAWTVARKTRRPAAPAARPSDSNADSDSDSGKENVMAGIRPDPPAVGVKRSRDEGAAVALDENEKGAAAREAGEPSSGRKSPKLGCGPASSASIADKHALRTPKPRITVYNTPTTASRGSKKPSGVKLGLKRF